LNSLAGTLGVVTIAQPPGTTNFGKSTLSHSWPGEIRTHFTNLKSSATNLLFLLGHSWGDGFNMFQHVSTTSRDQDMKLASTVLALLHLNICRNGKNFSLVSLVGDEWLQPISPMFGIGCRLSQKGEANGAETLEGMTREVMGMGCMVKVITKTWMIQ
jgi:hypothetical protein